MARSKYCELVTVKRTAKDARDVCAALRAAGIECKEWHGCEPETTGYQVLVGRYSLDHALEVYHSLTVDEGGPEYLPDRY